MTPMKRINPLRSRATTLSLASLGGTVSCYRHNQNIYSQGSVADSLYYIQAGRVRLITKSKDRASAVTAILGEGDLFGEQCLVGFPLRVSTAIAMIPSLISSIPKQQMTGLLQINNGVSDALVTYLLLALNKYQDRVAELLTLTAKQRLAEVLLRLAYSDNKGASLAEIPKPSQQVLAEMIGTTRPRVNFFMNDFKKHGYISYDGVLEVHKSLREVLRNK
jgi:CRP/FNR family cyclic AMP-dependent transcriptional regulator